MASKLKPMINPQTGRPFVKDFFKDHAEGQPCLVRVARVAGYECGSPETTVLCHPSIAGLKATGSRAASVPDIGAAHGCMVCHDLCDGRRKPVKGSALDDLNPADRKMLLQNALLEGVIRTITKLVKAGILPNP